jgi:hypothetical protein
MARRKRIRFAIAAVLVSAAFAVALLQAIVWRRESDFDFLRALHPQRLEYSAKDLRKQFSWTGGWLPDTNQIEVMAFPASKLEFVNQTIHRNLPLSSVTNEVDITMGYRPDLPTVPETELLQTFWHDPSGRHVVLVSGPRLGVSAKGFTDSPLPDDSCLVVACHPTTWVDRVVDRVRAFLHLS